MSSVLVRKFENLRNPNPTPATDVTLIDDHTLSVVTPAHAVGEVAIKVTFGSDIYQFPSSYQFTQSIDYDSGDNDAAVVHTFTAPANGLYQLEAWGAAGSCLYFFVFYVYPSRNVRPCLMGPEGKEASPTQTRPPRYVPEQRTTARAS